MAVTCGAAIEVPMKPSGSPNSRMRFSLRKVIWKMSSPAGSSGLQLTSPSMFESSPPPGATRSRPEPSLE